MEDSWLEEMKKVRLHEPADDQKLPLVILKRALEEQTKTNERMQYFTIPMRRIFQTWSKRYAKTHQDLCDEVISANMTVDGWIVNRAIEAQGNLMALEQQQKKKGLFDMFKGEK